MVGIATQGSTLLHIATGPLLKSNLESFHPIELVELLEKQFGKTYLHGIRCP